MKRKLLFLVSLLSASMALTACGDLGGGGEGGGGNNSITLPNTAEEAVNMFYQFATTNGIEITYRVYDDESAQPDVKTVGFKNDTFWVKESVAYKKDGTNLEMYEYDASKHSYEFQAAVTETAQMSLDAMLKNFTAVFYAGYEYAAQGGVGSFSAKQDVTFLSRPATEYTFSYAALDAQASLKIVFDNATGITLKIYGSASSGEGNSSAEFEVTSFAIGNAVRVPTLNKPSGQGGEGGGGQGGEGGGGQQDVDYFSNKLLVYASHQNAVLYLNSQLALFDDDKFELSFYESNYLVVKLGEYSVASNNVSATLSVKKVYKDRDQKYSAMNETLTLNYADGGYTLQVSASGKVNYLVSGQPPVHADIPEEGGSQTGEDAKYKVTETQWNNIIVNHGLISLTSNFTVVTTNSTGQIKYEFDNGKIHYTFTTSSFVTEIYYEFTSLTNGYVYYRSGSQWVKQASPSYMDSLYDSIGILPVPYSKVSFNSITHAYGCNSWATADSSGAQIIYQNPHFFFEDGNLIKLSYTQGDVDYLYNYNAYGQTSVTLPQVGGQTDQNARYKITSAIWEDMILDAGLVSLTSNFTAMVRASDLPQGQQNKYEFDNGKIHCVAADGYEYYQEFTSQSGGYTYSKNESGVWTKSNNTFGISSYMNSLGMLPLEFSQLTFNESTHEYELATFNDPYGGGVYASNIAISFVDNKLMKMSYTREGVYRETEFAKYGQTSVTLPEVGGGGQQQTSKWPAEDIANKLASLDINVTVPAPSVSEESIDSVSANIPADNSGLAIVITLTDTNNIAMLISGYMRGFTGFEPDYYSSEFSEDGYSGTYVLVNEAKDIIIKLTYDLNSPVFRIFIAKFTGNPYPSAKIAAFFTALELDVTFPDLSMDNVSYNFRGMPEEGFGKLVMEPMGENTNENIISNIETILLRNNFKVFYMPSYSDEGGLDALYIDSTCTYYVSFYEDEGTLYLEIIIGGEEMAAAVDFTYPQEKIAALTPEDLDDAIPSLAVDGAIYMIGEDGNGFQLQIHLQPGMNAENIISSLKTRIGRSGYTLSEDEGYHSANDQIAIYFNNCFDKIVEIQVRFIKEEPPIEEPVDVTYTLVSDNNWDITVDDAQLYAYCWKENGEFEWIPLEAEKAEDGTISFTLEIGNDYVGMKIVRFKNDSEIGWREGPDGSVNEDVTIWNQTGDIKLNGEGGDIHFSF